MADAQASGACGSNIVWVQVPSPASFFCLNIKIYPRWLFAPGILIISLFLLLLLQADEVHLPYPMYRYEYYILKPCKQNPLPILS